MKIKILVLLSLFAKYSYSCNCFDSLNVKETIKSVDFVFVAKIVSERTINYKDSILVSNLNTKDFLEFEDFYSVGAYKKEYTLELMRIYKGKKIKSKSFKLTTGVGNGDCGFDFELDKEYIIYGNTRKRPKFFEKKDIEYVYTSICTRTRLYNMEEEKEIMKYRKEKKCLPLPRARKR